MTPRKNTRAIPSWIWGLVVALVVAGVYLPILGNGFVYDSESQVLNDPFIHERANWADVLSLRVLSRDVMDFNRPANLASLMIDSALWGKTPWGYHLTNLLLHVGVCGLLFAFLMQCRQAWAGEAPSETTRSDGASHSQAPASHRATSIAAGVTLFFGLHPVNVEAVSEVSFREDLLVAFFSLLGLVLLGRAQSKKGQGSAGGRGSFQALALRLAAIACFFLAATSKETGMLTPLWLAGWLWLLVAYGRKQAALVIAKAANAPQQPPAKDGEFPRWLIPILAITTVCVGAFTVARFQLEPKHSLIFTQPQRLGGTLVDTLAIQTRIWAFYFRQMVWPKDLCADYGPYSLRNFSFIASLLALLGFLGFQGYSALRNRLFAFGALTFWLFILPVSNLVPMFRPMADRFLYFPMIGAALMAAGLAAELVPNWKVIALLAGTACVPLAIRTVAQEKTWHDSIALWSATRATNPASSIALNNLMDALNKQGKSKEALAVLENARPALRFATAETFAQKAVALDGLGQKEQAQAAFLQATRMNPKYATPDLLVQELTWARRDADKLQAIANRIPKN